MNNDQFDDLTRTLASGTSPRQLLRLMGSGLVALFVSMFTRIESENVCPKSNQVVGTCDDLKSHIDQQGVEDEKGVAHPDSLGWTNSYWSSSYRTTRPLVQINGNTTCLTVQNVRAQFYASPVSCQLTWTPQGLPTPLPANCQKAINAWHRAIERHEKHHRSDAIRAARSANARWSKRQHEYTGCGSDQATAEAALKAKISAALDFELDLTRQESNKLKAEFHATQEGKRIATPCDCDHCNPALGLSACGNQCCGGCEVCDSEKNTCVSTCISDCMQCKDGHCVSNCAGEEVCCGNECIKLSERNCCITSGGTYSCPQDWTCCGGGQCCDPKVSQCCWVSEKDLACVPYSNSSCVNCFPCNPGQECCIKANGVVAGCCEIGRCHPERGCT